MASIDTSKRKPRRTQGTPSFKYRNRFAYAFLAIGPMLFGLWCLTPMQRITNEKLRELTQQTEQEKDRRALFEFGAPRRAEFIREALKEADDLSKER
ncbi:hypothetical protein KR215_001670 [Drosophila sulfurigaster]|uniref:Uncharacterized protein LOC117572354 n=1 Tax=Drosophila albomicans TaxID=7291 RepID=A0A6P8X480_DROAB|nr:uncharacterized protein LOC117572354 [Drosophila albomicans]XP_060657630.1 uncharacterized protein LOC132792336 [Drosophila nasuta]XP_062130182.1 uncharacterized protein LOC133841601 [Drosophila sulfurigaster albostrigata]XP_062130184.1 uncharacterized protein LOC133841601 [Drosophila sulfurigaster albostrigata]KAH8390749.1 hypothetical protein KR215_001670 [Drosophila sulfurigaster]